MNNKIRILGAAFGDPNAEKTYSGVPKYLFGAIEKKADVIAYLSTKQLRLWDAFEGAIDFSKTFGYGKPGISINWLWRQKTVDKLTSRFQNLLNDLDYNHFDCVLQMGTHVRICINGIKHYCRTDMTIVQALQARQFSVAKLKNSRISEAIEVQKGIFESCAGIFVTSDWVKNSIVNDYGIYATKVHVIGAGASIPMNFDISKKQSNCNILFVGRDWERKGGPLLIEAFKKINEKIPTSKLTVIGCSPTVSCPNVEVLGYLDKNDVRQRRVISEAYMNSAILCVPSIFDPFGMCWIEAQLCGVVPVTFSGEGRSEAIKDGVTGILVRERTAKVLSEAILGLLRNPEKTRSMGEAGSEFVRNNLTWDHVADRILAVIQNQLTHS